MDHGNISMPKNQEFITSDKHINGRNWGWRYDTQTQTWHFLNSQGSCQTEQFSNFFEEQFPNQYKKFCDSTNRLYGFQFRASHQIIFLRRFNLVHGIGVNLLSYWEQNMLYTRSLQTFCRKKYIYASRLQSVIFGMWKCIL